MGTECVNTPIDEGLDISIDYSPLLVVRGNSDTLAQLCFNYYGGGIVVREANNIENGLEPHWQPWKKIAFQNDLGGLTFKQDSEGNWGYCVGGADAVIPFKSDGIKEVAVIVNANNTLAWGKIFNSKIFAANKGDYLEVWSSEGGATINMKVLKNCTASEDGGTAKTLTAGTTWSWCCWGYTRQKTIVVF